MQQLKWRGLDTNNNENKDDNIDQGIWENSGSNLKTMYKKTNFSDIFLQAYCDGIQFPRAWPKNVLHVTAKVYS